MAKLCHREFHANATFPNLLYTLGKRDLWSRLIQLPVKFYDLVSSLKARFWIPSHQRLELQHEWGGTKTFLLSIIVNSTNKTWLGNLTAVRTTSTVIHSSCGFEEEGSDEKLPSVSWSQYFYPIIFLKGFWGDMNMSKTCSQWFNIFGERKGNVCLSNSGNELRFESNFSVILFST